ncbi:MAG TPA: protein kinase [Vicinamibacterales bacterium]|nr:protein kinase [Vicinamibacterales bacterium]
MSNPSSLSGQRLGAYDVGPLLGVGGMGEVYRARDTKLNRDVAIKVLLPAVADDPERLARFRREAQTLASLNHPGIAQIHGIEDSSGGPFLVMELVDGPTLADRIAAGPLPVDEAIAIARQLADALEAAHERGVIHRDLKPANIKVCDDGSVRILDFGLAKALDSQAGGAAARSMANSPTIASPMTQPGLILGTAAYMSPEQAKGRVVDKRTDVWAFGCVLYEMLTGRRAFEGEDVTDTIASVMRAEPDWQALPADTPEPIYLLLKRSLEKDRRARIADISVARFLIAEPVARGAISAGSPAAAGRSSRLRVPVAALSGLLVGAALAAAVAWTVTPVPATPSPIRFAVVAPVPLPFLFQGNDRDIAITPDGAHLIYRSINASRSTPAQLVVRPLSELGARALSGTDGARNPFPSPDGKWVAFTAGGELRKIALAGGTPTTICKISGALRGAHWTKDDFIVYGTSAGHIYGVSANGGEPTEMTTPDEKKGELHSFPRLLPGGRAMLFVNAASSVEGAIIQAIDLTTKEQKTLIPGGLDPVYVEPGLLIYAPASGGAGTAQFGRSLRAVRFDAAKLALIGDSIEVADDIAITALGAANASISERGDLFYVPSSTLAMQVARRSLVWVNRAGSEESIPLPPHGYAVARLSPDGSRVALDVRDQTNDIWILDLARQTLTPLTRDPAQDMSPVWMPDAKRVLWASTRGGTTPNLYLQAADGAGAARRIATTPAAVFPTSISRDAKHLVAFGAALQAYDLFRVEMTPDEAKVQPLMTTAVTEFGPELSPDGRWLAYHSNESGEFQVYVRPFPNVNDGRWQISTTGGTRAAWSRDGSELFFLDHEGKLTVVPIRQSAAGFSAGTPVRILSTAYYAGFSILGLDLRAYDVASDGKRFLMIKSADGGDRPQTSSELIVVLHWLDEVKRRLLRQ